MLSLKEKRLNLLLKALCTWMFSFSAMSGIVLLTILQTNLVSIAILSAFFTAVFFLVFYNKYTVSVCALILMAAALYIYRSMAAGSISASLTGAITHFIDTWRFIRGLKEYSDSFNITTLRLLAAAVSCVGVMLIKLKYSYMGLFALGTGIFITTNATFPGGFYPTFFIMLLSLLILYVFRVNKAGGPVPVFKAARLCLLSIFIALLLPMPDTNLSRESFEKAYEQVYWFFREPFMPKYFSSRSMGFETDTEELGGNLRLNNNFIMNVFAGEPLYLSGVTKEIYTGSAWLPLEKGEFEPLSQMDATGNDSLDILDKLKREYGTFVDMALMGIEEKSLSVNIGKSRTGTIFKPDKSIDLVLYGDYSLAQRGMDLRCEPVFKKNAIYSLDYYKIDYENKFIKEMLLSSKRGYYMETAEALKLAASAESFSYIRRMRFINTIDFFENYKAPYADYLYENYTALPETVPQRVYDLAHSLTGKYETDYEKIQAIKSYLSAKTYSITPGDVPEGRDFVDYFLFDVNEGYCTYYATAMAVMARAIGMPSRYNEGYILPDTKTNDLYYEVYGTNAHAWAEVYFEGIGWVPFEATPPSFFLQYYPDAAAFYDYGDYYDEEMDYSNDYDRFYYGLPDNEADLTEAALANLTEEAPNSNRMILSLSVAVLFGGIYVLFRKIQEYRRHRIMKHARPNLAAIEAFKGILDFHGFYGIPIKNHEPALMYASRVGKDSPLGSVSLNAAAKIFSKARFAAEEISDAEASMLCQLYFLLYRRLKTGEMKNKFIIHRYIKKLNG